MSEKDSKEKIDERAGESFAAARSRDLTLRAMVRVGVVGVMLIFASLFLDWAGGMCVQEQLNPRQTFISKAICLPIMAITGAQAPPEMLTRDEDDWLERPEPTRLTVQRRSKQSFNLTPWTMKIVRGVLLIAAFGCCAYVVWLWVRSDDEDEDDSEEDEEAGQDEEEDGEEVGAEEEDR